MVRIATTLGGWATASWTVTLDAGQINIGISNVAVASYVIAYDNFRIIPAPGAAGLFAAAGLAAARRRR